ncbi:hypothetical protein GCM10009801_37670 [Streptomyces albiaxialis]|uniref:Uncharacterized protein n=1 Tax=Streptomyces albiaxialis TaxID=329523 RepID=A0ABN2W1U5_9ACTN
MGFLAKYGGGGSVEGGWLTALIVAAVLVAALVGLYLYSKKE